MVTYGDRRSNATLSLGFGHFNDGNDYTYPVQILTPGTYVSINGEYPDIPIQGTTEFKSGVKLTAPIIGLAGQTKVGKKASFIYDCMYVMATNNTNNGTQNIEYQYDQNSWILQQVVVGDWQVVNPQQNILIIMPGMRFQRTESKAFQISLAGVITDGNSFPLPMASWFYKF